MSTRGGKRPGAGRKAGVQNKVNKDLRERILASGKSPLEFLVDLMREPMPVRGHDENILTYLKRVELWDRNRVLGAKEAAPFIHAKLSSIEVTGKDGGDINHRHRVEIEFVEAKRK